MAPFLPLADTQNAPQHASVLAGCARSSQLQTTSRFRLRQPTQRTLHLPAVRANKQRAHHCPFLTVSRWSRGSSAEAAERLEQAQGRSPSPPGWFGGFCTTSIAPHRPDSPQIVLAERPNVAAGHEHGLHPMCARQIVHVGERHINHLQYKEGAFRSVQVNGMAVVGATR